MAPLKTTGGILAVDWQTDDKALHFVWSEAGVGTYPVPTKTGFGTTLNKTTIERQFDALAKMDGAPVGAGGTIVYFVCDD